MPSLPGSLIQGWRAHVYSDAARRDAAWQLCEAIAAALAAHATLGRLHEKPLGPNPMWSYPLALPAEGCAPVVGRLALNHGALDVRVHPDTGDDRRDHRDCATWPGRSHVPALQAPSG